MAARLYGIEVASRFFPDVTVEDPNGIALLVANAIEVAGGKYHHDHDEITGR